MRPIGVGVVGCGWIAEIVHLPNLRRHRRFRVEAVCDRSEARLAVAARLAPEARTYGEVKAVLRDPAVDVVLVALPPNANLAVVQAALGAGKSVYLEKPCAATLEDALALAQVWGPSGRTVMAGYNFRYNPAVEHAAACVRNGALGRLLSVQSRFTWHAGAQEGWRAEPSAGGGVLLDLASHHIDLFAHLTGDPVVAVSARQRDIALPGDTLDLTVQGAGGAVLQLHASLAGGAQTHRMGLLGADAQADVDFLDPQPEALRRGAAGLTRAARIGRAIGALHPARLLGATGYEPSFYRALDAFADACDGRDADIPDPASALAVLQVVEAARASVAQDGGWAAVGAVKR